MFNSREYAWKDIKAFIDGNLITGIQNVDYTTSAEHEAIYGRGDRPLAIQKGNKSYEGNVTLLQSEYEELRKAVRAAGYKDVTDPDFTISVSYGNTAMQTDVIGPLSFGELPKSLGQNDKNMTLEMPFIALDIQEDV